MQSIGNYDLLEMVAEGGMGTVYRGRHRVTGAIVAVKVVPPHIASNPVYVKRFEQEYNAARALDHPNIVRALEFGREGPSPYLVMEFVEGESLGQRLERDRLMGEAAAIDLIAQVALGLERAHMLGLVHRDVKPDNILLTPDGQAKLTDLGLVKELETDLNLTRTGRGLGTPHFMAPEQFRNAKNADARCDIYSLAATLYMMVTGELPFQSTGPLDAWMKKVKNDIAPPAQLVPELSTRIDWAIRRALNADPSQRPANCREFVEDLKGQSDARRTPVDDAPETTIANLWHLLYRDPEGMIHTTRETTSGVRSALRDGSLGVASELRMARKPQGPFEPARNFAEFRDLILESPVVRNVAIPRPPVTPTPESRSSMPTPDDSPIVPLAAASVKPLGPSGSTGPLIDLGNSETASEWLVLLVWMGLALVAGVIGFVVLPALHWRVF